MSLVLHTFSTHHSINTLLYHYQHDRKVAYVASLATKLSDTCGSEIGKAYGKTTYLITTLKIVPKGTATVQRAYLLIQLFIHPRTTHCFNTSSSHILVIQPLPTSTPTTHFFFSPNTHFTVLHVLMTISYYISFLDVNIRSCFDSFTPSLLHSSRYRRCC